MDSALTNSFTDIELITNPIFRRLDNDLLHLASLSNVAKTIAKTEYHKVLGDGIPAISFAAGANDTNGLTDNYDFQSETPNGWPEEQQEKIDDDTTLDLWMHSDLKNVAFFYVYKLYEKSVRGN